MLFLSQRVQSLALPMTIEMTKKSRALQEAGHDIISLSLGEPDFDSPDFAKLAGIEGIEKNYSHYMPVPGYADLREAICQKFARDNGLNYRPDEIIVSTGAKQSIANLMMALVNPGDEVIIPAPYWVSYADLAEFVGGTVVSPKAGIEQNFKITANQLRESISDKTKLLIFSSPNNPSGAMYSRIELESLAVVLREYPHIWVISDEIYEYIHYGVEHVSMASLEGMWARTATVNGLSKGFAMTGWRLGFMGAPPELAKACEKIQSQITSGASSIAQRAAIAAVLAGPAPVQYMIDAFTRRRSLLANGLKAADKLLIKEPEGAFYLFVDASEYLSPSHPSALAICMALLEGGVAAVPGEAFGLDGYIRFSYAASEEDLRKAAERIVRTLNGLNSNS
ncbi:MAG: pyridoxal phosphate-dependent aminotransferase [Schleiferiaceae bacterium]|nr:pyridoxal phosphate-dependent aminotransferase [Schleiferiaceae bacterium]